MKGARKPVGAIVEPWHMGVGPRDIGTPLMTILDQTAADEMEDQVIPDVFRTRSCVFVLRLTLVA